MENSIIIISTDLSAKKENVFKAANNDVDLIESSRLLFLLGAAANFSRNWHRVMKKCRINRVAVKWTIGHGG